MLDLLSAAERGRIPDWLIRVGIRRLLTRRLDDTHHELNDFVSVLRESPLAIATDSANTQHYEVPADFFTQVLGPRLKYSSCLYATPQTTLGEAEEAMLQLTCERAELSDGMKILELGCGWGSLSLWLAKHYSHSEVTAISNSNSQREFIESKARSQGLDNLTVQTCDMRNFSSSDEFDRVISVEMFEHMRNYELLLQRVSQWLKPDGKLFVHIFCHRDNPYLFETEGAANWMGRHFFTGGMMPSEQLLPAFNDDLSVEQQWRVSGLHYWRTCEDWLANLDRARSALLQRFSQDMSHNQARVCLQRWRMFFMACAELFRYNRGQEWFVAHYRMQQAHKRSAVEKLGAEGAPESA